MNTNTHQLTYYQQIPEYPDNYNPGNVIARMIDGLGYRYYWATDALTEKDLNYQPTPASMSFYKTIEHLYWLSIMTKNACQNGISVRMDPSEFVDFDFEKLRSMSLANFKVASEAVAGKTAAEMSELKVTIQSKDATRSFPFWNALNGPIADALYHVGQLVSFRRTTGNPLNPKVRVFLGRNAE